MSDRSGDSAAQRPRGVLTRVLLSAVALAWLGAIAAGFAVLLRYSSTSGVAAGPPQRWPTECVVARAPDRFTLMVFAHPRCPCTAASVEQLDRLLVHLRDRVRVCILFCIPPDTGDDWARTSLWEKASAIPGIAVHVDDSGLEARRFGARTSGQALLYGPEGTLRFSGGLTSARGHVGDSDGEAAIRGIVCDGDSRTLGASVFGCSLFDADMRPTPAP